MVDPAVFPVPPALRAPYRPPAHGAAAASLGVEGALCTRVTLWQQQPTLGQGIEHSTDVESSPPPPRVLCMYELST